MRSSCMWMRSIAEWWRVWLPQCKSRTSPGFNVLLERKNIPLFCILNFFADSAWKPLDTGRGRRRRRGGKKKFGNFLIVAAYFFSASRFGLNYLVLNFFLLPPPLKGLRMIFKDKGTLYFLLRFSGVVATHSCLWRAHHYQSCTILDKFKNKNVLKEQFLYALYCIYWIRLLC